MENEAAAFTAVDFFAGFRAQLLHDVRQDAQAAAAALIFAHLRQGRAAMAPGDARVEIAQIFRHGRDDFFTLGGRSFQLFSDLACLRFDGFSLCREAFFRFFQPGFREPEVMMRAEEVERRLRLAESRLKETEESLAAERKTIEAQAGEIRKQLEASTAEREKIIAPVPEDLRDLYARIARRHGGTALAQVREDQCRGCGLRVLPHIVQELRSETSEEVYRCESCGLILHSLEPVPYAKTAGGSAKAASP